MFAVTRTPSRGLLLLLAVALFAAGCTGGGKRPSDGESAEPQAQGEPVEGGRVVFGQDQEPEILNQWLNAGNLQATAISMNTVLYPLWRITPEFEYQPLLLDGEPEVTQDPFTVTYKLREDAIWSDGTPITVDDIEFTLDYILDPAIEDIVSRDGYDKIDRKKTERVDDKTITYHFNEPYAPYRDLFSVQPILPKHALEGQDRQTFLTDSVPVASGPFEFVSWTKGQNITVKRNERFWGDGPHLDEIVFRFIEDSNTQVQALRGREVDLFYPQPQLELVEELDKIDGVEFEVNAGPTWEHLDFNFAVKPLDQKFVRQGIIQGIDRDALAEQLIAPMYPQASVLQNVIYVNTQEQYEPHWDRWKFDPEAARKLFEDNGCTEGDDKIYVCNGTRLSFVYVTTAGNELRELQMQIIQSQLKDIGVEVRPNLQEAAQAFGTTLISGDKGAWGLFNFAWVGSPDPASGNTIWMCKGGQNYNSYCNEDVTKLIAQTNTTIDVDQRAKLFNEADELMAEDALMAPLYQKPTLLGWHDDLIGMKDNTTQWGPTWNVEEWSRTKGAGSESA